MIQFGLCGRTLKHSYSKIIHSYLGNDNYELINLERDEFYELMESKAFKALNVTIPYKIDAYNLCDVVSNEAKIIGCVNTVVNRDGILYGYNTDFFGFEYMLKRSGISLKDKNIVILGSGGTSLTATAVAKSHGAKSITTVSRSGKINYNNVYELTNTQVIINTTPVGMYPDNQRSPVDITKFTYLTDVIDVIYNPIKTKLIATADENSIRCTSGLSMLVAQAVRADELFFGKKNGDDIIEDVISKCIMKTSNIVLVGMPGCGKTTVGKILSQKTGKLCFDTDDFVEKCGMPIPEIFEKFGEENFREKETQAVKMLCSMSEKIISTGGGSILKKENIDYMRQNGIIVYIRRELDKLSTDGRPLSAGGTEKLERIYKTRQPLYEKYSDISVDIDENPEKCAQKILTLIPEFIKNNYTTRSSDKI